MFVCLSLMVLPLQIMRIHIIYVDIGGCKEGWGGPSPPTPHFSGHFCEGFHTTKYFIFINIRPLPSNPPPFEFLCTPQYVECLTNVVRESSCQNVREAHLFLLLLCPRLFGFFSSCLFTSLTIGFIAYYRISKDNLLCTGCSLNIVFFP